MQINACNGLRCGETFAGPNSPNKPSLWTENWTSKYDRIIALLLLLLLLLLFRAGSLSKYVTVTTQGKALATSALYLKRTSHY